MISPRESPAVRRWVRRLPGGGDRPPRPAGALRHLGLTAEEERGLQRSLPLSVAVRRAGRGPLPAGPDDVLLHLGQRAPAVDLLGPARHRAAVVTDADDVRGRLGLEGGLDRAALIAQAAALAVQPELRDRYRHRAWREVSAAGAGPASVSAVVATMRPHRLEDVVAFVAAQHHPEVELVLVTHGFTPSPGQLRELQGRHGIAHLVHRTGERRLTLGACLNLGVASSSGAYVAKMDDDNHYPPHYLLDLVRHAEQSGAEVTGKGAHHVHLEGIGATVLRFPEREHRWTGLVQGGSLLARRAVVAEIGFDDVPRAVDTRFLAAVRRGGGRVWAADRFNFVSVRGADPGQHTWALDDHRLLARASRLQFFGDPLAHVTV